ncbi:MAG: diacylglycerol/lipid kinase family protein [Planctomycetota bacterium]
MTRQIVAILNPVSGACDMLPVVQQIGRSLERRGSQLDIHVTGGTGHATEIAAELHHDVDAVLVVGGDGTVCEVVNGIIGRPDDWGLRIADCGLWIDPKSTINNLHSTIPIVILGTGTENLIAHELGMPSTPERVVETLLSGEPFACDVGVINQRHFLAVAGVGFDADCVLRFARARQGHITHGDYFWPIWRTFWTHRFPTLRVEVDNACVFEGHGFAMVGIIGRYAAGLRILSEARYNDGLLDLCVFACNSKARLLGHAGRLFLGRHVGSRGVIYRQGRQISITSPDQVHLEVDGDAAGCLPATCHVLPGAARFLGPQDTANVTNIRTKAVVT